MRSKGVDGYGRKKKRCYVTDKAKSMHRDQVPGCGEVDEDRGAGERRPEHLPLSTCPSAPFRVTGAGGGGFRFQHLAVSPRAV